MLFVRLYFTDIYVSMMLFVSFSLDARSILKYYVTTSSADYSFVVSRAKISFDFLLNQGDVHILK